MNRPIELLEVTFRRLSSDLDQLDKEAHADVRIDEDSLKQDILQHADKYLRWARMSSMAQNEHNRASQHVKRVFAEAKQKARTDVETLGGKCSDSKAEELASLRPEYQQAVEDAQQAEQIWNHFKDSAYAMFQRKEMIVEYNKLQHREFSSYRYDSAAAGAEELPSLTTEELKKLRAQQLQERKVT